LDRAADVVAVDRFTVVVVDFAAVVDAVAAAVDEVVGEVPAAALVVAPLSVRAVAALVTVEAVAWRAMPRPRALAMPMLRDATRARLRAAGWGRFVLMTANLRTGCEPTVRLG
jgi:hypothetical protein